MFVKICGICSLHDYQAVAALGPDAVGFIFWPLSPRYVIPEEVGFWIAATNVKPAPLKVGVFVDEPAERVGAIVLALGLDVVQLHGREDADYCLNLRQLLATTGRMIRVWKVVRMDKDEPQELGKYCVDAFLLDSYTARLPGGTGQKIDWEEAQRWCQRLSKPIILAGGLQPDNVATAIKVVDPWGVDVNSGVESEVRVKDLPKTEEFIKQCRTNS